LPEHGYSVTDGGPTQNAGLAVAYAAASQGVPALVYVPAAAPPAAFAALMTGTYRPAEGERIAVVVCGANTDPATLATPPSLSGTCEKGSSA
jgi:threonine dehydratase